MDIRFESREANGRTKTFDVKWNQDDLCHHWGTVAYGKDKCCGHGSDNFLNMPSLKKHVIDGALTITCTLTPAQDLSSSSDSSDYACLPELEPVPVFRTGYCRVVRM